MVNITQSVVILNSLRTRKMAENSNLKLSLQLSFYHFLTVNEETTHNLTSPLFGLTKVLYILEVANDFGKLTLNCVIFNLFFSVSSIL